MDRYLKANSAAPKGRGLDAQQVVSGEAFLRRNDQGFANFGLTAASEGDLRDCRNRRDDEDHKVKQILGTRARTFIPACMLVEKTQDGRSCRLGLRLVHDVRGAGDFDMLPRRQQLEQARG